MIYLKFIVIGFCLLHCVSAVGYDRYEQNILKMVNASCQVSAYRCPNKDYATFEKDGSYVWNNDAVLNSDAIQSIKTKMPVAYLLQLFRMNFCCEEGTCLQKCLIYRRIEKEVVENFPFNVDAIMSLGIEGLEQFREPLAIYLATEGYSKPDKNAKYPAIIQDYFDFIDLHQDEIIDLLAKADH